MGNSCGGGGENRNPFGNGTMPWTAVDTAKVDLDDFIRLHLDGLQTDEAMR